MLWWPDRPAESAMLIGQYTLDYVILLHCQTTVNVNFSSMEPHPVNATASSSMSGPVKLPSRLVPPSPPSSKLKLPSPPPLVMPNRDPKTPSAASPGSDRKSPQKRTYLQLVLPSDEDVSPPHKKVKKQITSVSIIPPIQGVGVNVTTGICETEQRGGKAACSPYVATCACNPRHVCRTCAISTSSCQGAGHHARNRCRPARTSGDFFQKSRMAGWRDQTHSRR